MGPRSWLPPRPSSSRAHPSGLACKSGGDVSSGRPLQASWVSCTALSTQGEGGNRWVVSLQLENAGLSSATRPPHLHWVFFPNSENARFSVLEGQSPVPHQALCVHPAAHTTQQDRGCPGAPKDRYSGGRCCSWPREHGAGPEEARPRFHHILLKRSKFLISWLLDAGENKGTRTKLARASNLGSFSKHWHALG